MWGDGMGVVWKIDGIYNANAEKVYEEITSIGDKFTPEDILNKAILLPESELHKCFEWDDTKAARKYRLNQAGDIIRMLVVNTTDIKPDAKPNLIRAIVTVENAPQQYESMAITVANVDRYSELLTRAKKELETFKNKYSILSELQPLFDEISALA